MPPSRCQPPDHMFTPTVFCASRSTGAVAQLYDISCLYQASPTLFQTIQQPLYEAWANMTSDVTVQQITAILPALLSPDVVLADHYFVPNPSGTGLSPMWDMRATKRFQGNQNAFMLGKSDGTVASPVDPSLNINWLRVAEASGDAADEVYRIDTLGGQPPTSVSIPSHQFRDCGSLMVILRCSALLVRPRISASDTLPSIGSLGDHCSSDLRHRSEPLIPHWWRARGLYPPVFEVSLSLVSYRALQV